MKIFRDLQKLFADFLSSLKEKFPAIRNFIEEIENNKFLGNKDKNIGSKDTDSKENSGDNLLSNNQKHLRSKQSINMLIGVIGILIIIFAIVKVQIPFGKSSTNSNIIKPKIAKKEESDSGQFQLELASKSIKGEKKWQSYLEDKIDAEQKARNEQLKTLQDSLDRKDDENKEAQESEFQEIKTRLSFVLNTLDKLQKENSSIRDELSMLDQKEEIVQPAELAINNTYEEEEISAPESMYNYIPATSYVTGIITSGVNADTLTEFKTDPVPITIKLTDRGSLPKDFVVDIKECNIQALCFGNLSSERVKIVPEQLVCTDKKNRLIITTDIVGYVTGNDGIEGIRGEVVSMAEKHLKNVFLSSALSGFTQTLKGSQGVNLSAFGAINTKKRGPQELAKDSLLSGGSTAADMLAEFNINLAKSIAPVIATPGGVKVDVSFTEGVRIGSRGLKKKFEKARKEKK